MFQTIKLKIKIILHESIGGILKWQVKKSQTLLKK